MNLTGGPSIPASVSEIYMAIAGKSQHSYPNTGVSISDEKAGEIVIADTLSKWVEVSKILDGKNVDKSGLNQAVLDYVTESGHQYKLGFPFDVQN